MLTALALTLLMAEVQDYVIALDGADVGFAQLTVDRQPRGRFAYAFRAELTVSNDPCLRSAESSGGKALLGDPVLPEELFVALAPDLGQGCRVVRGAGQSGRGCWTEVSGAEARGTLFEVPVIVQAGSNLMPVAVHYPSLGLDYRAVVEVPEGLAACQRSVADEGVPAPGGSGLGRALTQATYALASGSFEVHRPQNAMPPALAAIVADVRARELDSCQVVAATLDAQLAAARLQGREVVGLLLDQGRYYPHAWNEVRVGKEWLAVDASMGSGWADAGHLKVGLLGEFQSGLALLRLLHTPPKISGAK